MWGKDCVHIVLDSVVPGIMSSLQSSWILGCTSWAWSIVWFGFLPPRNCSWAYSDMRCHSGLCGKCLRTPWLRRSWRLNKALQGCHLSTPLGILQYLCHAIHISASHVTLSVSPERYRCCNTHGQLLRIISAHESLCQIEFKILIYNFVMAFLGDIHSLQDSFRTFFFQSCPLCRSERKISSHN